MPSSQRWGWYAVVLIGALAFSAYLSQQRSGQAIEHAPPPLILGVSSSSITTVDAATSTSAATTTIATNARVVRVIDGDTIVARIDGDAQDERIRLLGINTPEVVDPRKPVECFGKEASAKAKSILLPGLRIELRADPQADERDAYGRLLREVILADGTSFNALMVTQGYAYAMTDFPMDPAYKRELKQDEKRAKMGQIGLWSPQTCDGQKTL